MTRRRFRLLSMTTHTTTRALVISGMLLLAPRAFAQQYSYVLIDVSCEAAASACPAGLAPGSVATQTSAKGINARGEIVGSYVSAGGIHGFLLKDGSYSSIDFPVAGVRATIANGINPQGDIVGQYTLPVNTSISDEDSPLYCPPNLPSPPNPVNTPDPACIKGFFYRNGQFLTVMFPGHPGAIAQRITPAGDIYGCLHGHDLAMSMSGAAWHTAFDPSVDSLVIKPKFSLTFDGGELSDPTAIPMSMNNGATPGGQTVIGFYTTDQQHGYLVRNGILQPYDPTLNTNLTAIWDINPAQQFVGTYRMFGELPSQRHGFVQLPDDSAPITFDVNFKDALGHTITAFATIAFGISPDGLVVGQYALVSNGPTHGFVALPVRGN
jgi:hypothetical protein